MKIRILTYNIHGLPWCKQTIDLILLWIFYKCEADIVCFQECFTHYSRQMIEEACKRRGWNFYFPDDPPGLRRIIPSFQSGSGLCIIARKNITLLSKLFIPFKIQRGVENFVSKGFFICKFMWNGVQFQIVNTHLQSDFTEFKCIRINYPAIRAEQEKEMWKFLQYYSFPIIIGDCNQNLFYHFHCLDENFHVTFPDTGEHLDHCIMLDKDIPKIKQRKVCYYDEIDFSDHIPVLYTIEV